MRAIYPMIPEATWSFCQDWQCQAKGPGYMPYMLCSELIKPDFCQDWQCQAKGLVLCFWPPFFSPPLLVVTPYCPLFDPCAVQKKRAHPF
jgi:hypothetical protein